MSSNRTTTLGCGGFIAVLVLVAVAIFVSYKTTTYHQHIATCTVTGHDRVSTSQDGSSDARVYTRQCDTLRVADSTWLGVHNASNIYGQIQDHHRYRFEIAGYRSGWSSTFPRVVRIVADLGPATATS